MATGTPLVTTSLGGWFVGWWGVTGAVRRRRPPGVDDGGRDARSGRARRAGTPARHDAAGGRGAGRRRERWGERSSDVPPVWGCPATVRRGPSPGLPPPA